VPHRQTEWPLNHVVVRSRHARPGQLAELLRATVADAGLGVEVDDLATAEQIVGRSLSGPRFQALLLGLFAVLALVLGAVGLYGVMSYLLSVRRQEMGVRMALGAEPGDLARMALGEALGLAALGCGLGVAASFALTRLLASSLAAGLHGTGAADFASLGGAVLVLLLAALAAGLPPALRAARADPTTAMRAG